MLYIERLASYSSVSASLNALPAIIVEDYIKPFKPGLSDLKLGYISKIISAVGGMLSFALIFVIASVGNILPVRMKPVKSNAVFVYFSFR